ncbi:hypothetical protein GCM10009801_18650 [Streptomyces albiaxialis]|uniref:Uncharacterized protein n=1 Tax=Streptomyces albiaxialis TaxID=329523 RepID=A0ABN2VQF2_9ACTN
MGFFDDLVLPEEPVEQMPLLRLGPPGEDAGRFAPPLDWFAPALLPQRAVVGSGPHVRVVLTGWSVWPDGATLHLSVHRKVRRQKIPSGRQSGLRVGLELSDGRRVTSLDAPRQRHLEWTSRDGETVSAVTRQAVGLIPLDGSRSSSSRSVFAVPVDLYLAELPPPGGTGLVVEWPDEDVPETRTPVDASALRAASAGAVEIWPGIEPPAPVGEPGSVALVEMGGPPAFLAPPTAPHRQAELEQREKERRRYVPRADWEDMSSHDWNDPR